MQRYRVYLNPDGTHPAGLAVIVHAATGVTYGTQCGGFATDQREAEGFLVLCPSEAYDLPHSVEAELEQWFAARAPHGELGNTWPASFVTELAAIVERVVFWFTTPAGEETRGHISLDVARLNECMEAWVPVVTPIGPGVLTFNNSD